MANKHCRFRKYAKRKARMKAWDERLVALYWRYSHQVNGNLNQTGAW